MTLIDPEAVDAVLKTGPHFLDGRQVDCKLAIPKDTMMNIDPNTSILNTKKIFVGGLHPLLEESQMKQYFEKFGPIEQCVIMHDKPTGKSRGFGFVIFAQENSAEIVMQFKNQHCIMGKWVECKRAMPKEVLNKDITQIPRENNYNNNFKVPTQNFYSNGDVPFFPGAYPLRPGSSNNLNNIPTDVNFPIKSNQDFSHTNPGTINQQNFPNSNLPINQNWVVNNYCKNI